MYSQASVLIKPENTALIVIDMQEKLLPVIYNRDQVLKNAGRLVKFAKIMGMSIVFTEQVKLGATIQDVGSIANGYRFIPKTTFDCFGCDDFVTALNDISPRNLLICGIEAHICVAQTAISALADYNVHMVSDASGSRNPDNQKIAENRLRSAGATITSLEMAIYELTSDSRRPEFKDVLKLVK